MTVSVFSDLNHENTVRRYLSYILSLLSTKDHEIQIMYGIRGEKRLEEIVLEHLSGYLDSRPVRVGNAAYTQSQNDVYGVLLDVILKSMKHLDLKFDAHEEIWTIVRMLVRTVLDDWREPDSGIWEFRGSRQHFVYSKVMCWVAVDRGIRIAAQLGMSIYVEDWMAQRDIIFNDVMENGWRSDVGAFVQYYGATQLDAANLLMEYYGFIDAKDPRFVSTVMKSREQLCRNGLMYRYKGEDDFGLPSSAFTVCTFWLVYALHRIGMKNEAKELFENVLTHRNALGLLAEDIHFEDGRQLGNFPQAYSHLALITCARLFSSDTEESSRYSWERAFKSPDQ
jgi:GH15 family glucan-1,4-alpha-glucosidase